MKHDDKDLEKIYKEAFKDALEYMKNYPTQAVAATYMAIAMRLYKTSLSEESFNKIKEVVMETDVEPYRKPRLH